jgi:hypothetical protein
MHVMSQSETDELTSEDQEEEEVEESGKESINPDLRRTKTSSRGIRRRAPRQEKRNETEGTPE